jgi:hypothetical protein
MSTFNRAQEIENIAKKFAWLLLILAILFLSNAIETLIPDTVTPYIDYFQIPCAILILLISIPVVRSSILVKRTGSYDMFEDGGYIGAMFQKAAAKAFIFTYAITVILAVLDNLVLNHLTAENFAYIVLTYSLTAFSIAFFILTRDSDHNDSE